ncbi:hypothetical protein [Halorubrum sp. AS12]
MVLREAVLGALTEDRMTITQADVMEAVEDFEERDNLKNMDMIDGEGAEVLGETGSNDAHDHGEDGGHDHGDHDHGEDGGHDHGDHDHDGDGGGSADPTRGAEPHGRTQD